MKILGIDHGKTTGLCIYVDKRIYTNVLEVEGNTRAEKYLDFHNKIYKIISDNKPDIVCLELPSSFKNAEATRQLVGYYAITNTICSVYGVQVVDIKPTNMKKTITGKGNATKEEVYNALINKHGVSKTLLFQPEYFKAKNRCNTIRKLHYDKSDATGLVLTHIINERCNV